MQKVVTHTLDSLGNSIIISMKMNVIMLRVKKYFAGKTGRYLVKCTFFQLYFFSKLLAYSKFINSEIENSSVINLRNKLSFCMVFNR